MSIILSIIYKLWYPYKHFPLKLANHISFLKWFLKPSQTVLCIIKSILIKAQFQLIASSLKLHNSILLSTMLNRLVLNFELNINLHRDFSEAVQRLFFAVLLTWYNLKVEGISYSFMAETTLLKRGIYTDIHNYFWPHKYCTFSQRKTT